MTTREEEHEGKEQGRHISIIRKLNQVLAGQEKIMAEIDDLQREVQETAASLSALETRVDALLANQQPLIDSLTAQVQTLTDELAASTAASDTAKAAAAQAAADLDALQQGMDSFHAAG
jgi:phage shock protein A